MHLFVPLATPHVPPVGDSRAEIHRGDPLLSGCPVRTLECSPAGHAALFYARSYPQVVPNLLAGSAVYGMVLIWFVLAQEPMGIQLRSRLSRYFGETHTDANRN